MSVRNEGEYFIEYDKIDFVEYLEMIGRMAHAHYI
jgi:hypothetical protein